MKKILELAGALIIKDNSILLMHRNTENSVQWELPGGKVEKDESTEKTVVRELMEELDVKVKIEKYLGYKETEEDDAILKYHWYKCAIEDNGKPKLMEKKFDNLKYFSKEELDNCMELSSNMKTLRNTIDIGMI